MANEQTPSLAPATAAVAVVIAAPTLTQTSSLPESLASSTFFSPASETGDSFAVSTSKELKECCGSSISLADTPPHNGLASISPDATRDNSAQTSPTTAPVRISPLPQSVASSMSQPQRRPLQQQNRMLTARHHEIESNSSAVRSSNTSECSQAPPVSTEASSFCKQDATNTNAARSSARLARSQSSSTISSIGGRKSRKDGDCAMENKNTMPFSKHERQLNGEQKRNGNTKSKSSRYKRRGQQRQQQQEVQQPQQPQQPQQHHQQTSQHRPQNWTNNKDSQGLHMQQPGKGVCTLSPGSSSGKSKRQPPGRLTMKADADISSNGSYGTHEGETEDSEDEYAIGFSLEEWEYEVGGWVVLPTGLEKTLTAQILHTYETRLFPSAESIELKRAFIEKFATILTNEFPDLEVDIHVFGSSVNGLGTSRSDVDICLTTEHRELENVFLLNKALRKHGMRTYCVPQARVPIVKAWDPELRVASDININSTIALHNTRMIQTFVAIDSRVRPFVMAVKHWTKCRELNDAAFGGTLSPYAWVNVALNFLQTRSPPILPVLHPPSASLSAQETTREGNLDLAFNDNIDELRGFGLANTESLGFLLYAFFRRYAYEFDYRYQVVSLRHGCTLTKTQKGWDTGRPSRIFCIEEPFLTWLNLGHSANTTSVEGIRQEFKRGFQILRNGGSFEMVCEAYKRPQRSLALSPVTSVSTANTAVGRPQRNTSAVAGDHRSAPQHSRSRSHLHERNGGRHRSTSSSCSSSGFVPERLEYRRSSSFHPDKKPYHHPQHDSNCYQQQEYHDYGYAHIQPNSAATLADTFQRISLSASEEHDDTMDNQLATANDSTLTAADYAKLPSSYSAGYCRSPYGIYHSTISLPQEHAVQRKDSYDGMTYCSAAVPEGEGEYPSGPRNRSRQRIQHWHATPSHIYAHHQHDGYELAHHHCTQDGVYHHYSG